MTKLYELRIITSTILKYIYLHNKNFKKKKKIKGSQELSKDFHIAIKNVRKWRSRSDMASKMKMASWGLLKIVSWERKL